MSRLSTDSHSGSHQAVYHAYPPASIQTLGQAIRVLYAVPQPILRYRQRISLVVPSADLLFAPHVHHDRANHLLTISFPDELVGVVARIRNSHRCRMVTYWKDPLTDFIREIQIDSSTEVNRLTRAPYEQTIRVYTGGVEDLVVSFDVWLFKGPTGASDNERFKGLKGPTSTSNSEGFKGLKGPTVPKSAL